MRLGAKWLKKTDCTQTKIRQKKLQTTLVVKQNTTPIQHKIFVTNNRGSYTAT